MFIDGIAVDRIIGFEDLGGEDEFPTMKLIRALVDGGVLNPRNNAEAGVMKVSRKKAARHY